MRRAPAATTTTSARVLCACSVFSFPPSSRTSPLPLPRSHAQILPCRQPPYHEIFLFSGTAAKFDIVPATTMHRKFHELLVRIYQCASCSSLVPRDSRPSFNPFVPWSVFQQSLDWWGTGRDGDIARQERNFHPRTESHATLGKSSKATSQIEKSLIVMRIFWSADSSTFLRRKEKCLADENTKY